MGPRERIVVSGGARLVGEVRVTGAKNSVLKTMAASLLAAGTTTLLDVPEILDVEVMSALLRTIGCEAVHDGSTVRITVPEEPGHEADYDLVRRIRGSICVLGPLIGRMGRAKVGMPGGDAIGSRGLDLHVAGLRALGADVEIEHGYLVAHAGRLVGTRIELDFPSVGATENIVMAAILAKGSSLVDNVAREPEIVDLLEMLVKMGAKIDGIGTPTLEIEGVDELTPAHHVTVPDRIVAGTFAVAAAMTRGDITVRNARADHLSMPLDKLRAAGAEVTVTDDGFRVQMDGPPQAVDVATLPYPGFPTDLQPQFVALASVSEGTAMVTENIFDGRFVFVGELARLGADVRMDGHHCIVRGRAGHAPALSGAPVRASDIRAGVGLVLAGLVADGRTDVYDAYHVDRGYAGFCEQLTALGATVHREVQPDDAD